MTKPMPSGPIWTFRIIDWGILFYWTIIGLGAANILAAPKFKSIMYDGYGTAVIDAWDGSFAPLDILLGSLANAGQMP